MQFSREEVVGISCRSLLFLHHGVKGTLYRTGEYIVADDVDGGQNLIRATSFFSVPAEDQTQYMCFLKGELYEPQKSAEGTELFHQHSSSPMVVPTSIIEVVPAAAIMRKVMLYPDPNNLDFICCCRL